MPTATPPSPHRPPKTDALAQSPRPAWDLPRLLRLLIPVLALVVIVGIVVNLVGGGDQMSKLAWDRTPIGWTSRSLPSTAAAGGELSGVTDIAIHYVGNPGTTAQQNHDYYDQPDTTVSSHFLIGLDGEIIQCIPMDEKSSATNDRNLDTLSIEVCHPDATGQFTQASYDALVKLTAWLCDYCGIGRDHVIRHYDVTGKLCPSTSWITQTPGPNFWLMSRTTDLPPAPLAGGASFPLFSYSTKNEERAKALSSFSIPLTPLLHDVLTKRMRMVATWARGGTALGNQGPVLHPGNQALTNRPVHGRNGVVTDLIPVGIARQVLLEGNRVHPLVLGKLVQHGRHLLPGDGAVGGQRWWRWCR